MLCFCNLLFLKSFLKNRCIPHTFMHKPDTCTHIHNTYTQVHTLNTYMTYILTYTHFIHITYTLMYTQYTHTHKRTHTPYLLYVLKENYLKNKILQAFKNWFFCTVFEICHACLQVLTKVRQGKSCQCRNNTLIMYKHTYTTKSMHFPCKM